MFSFLTFCCSCCFFLVFLPHATYFILYAHSMLYTLCLLYAFSYGSWLNLNATRAEQQCGACSRAQLWNNLIYWIFAYLNKYIINFIASDKHLDCADLLRDTSRVGNLRPTRIILMLIRTTPRILFNAKHYFPSFLFASRTSPAAIPKIIIFNWYWMSWRKFLKFYENFTINYCYVWHMLLWFLCDNIANNNICFQLLNFGQSIISGFKVGGACNKPINCISSKRFCALKNCQ